MYQGLMVNRGLMGQYGSDAAMIQTVQAIAGASRIWHQPSAGPRRYRAQYQ